MALSFLGDENLPGRLARAIQRHNAQGLFPIDYLRVGDPKDLPLGRDDSVILLWIERNQRVLLTLDEHTMSGHLQRHLQTGHHIPGIFMIHPNATMPDVIDFLVLTAYASDLSEWHDQIRYVP